MSANFIQISLGLLFLTHICKAMNEEYGCDFMHKLEINNNTPLLAQ